MNFPAILVILFGLASCGIHISTKTGESREPFSTEKSCVVPVTYRGIFTPKISIPAAIILEVEKEFQGRPFNRNAFWNILDRHTRYKLNMSLLHQQHIPEELLLKGAVLFFENLIETGKKSFHLNASGFHAVIASEDATGETEASCEKHDPELADIDIGRLTLSRSKIEDLRCEAGRQEFTLRIFENSIVLIHREETAIFTGGEIIRDGDKITALAPDQRSLEMILRHHPDEKEKRTISIRFLGKQSMVIDVGVCTILRK